MVAVFNSLVQLSDHVFLFDSGKAVESLALVAESLADHTACHVLVRQRHGSISVRLRCQFFNTGTPTGTRQLPRQAEQYECM